MIPNPVDQFGFKLATFVIPAKQSVRERAWLFAVGGAARRGDLSSCGGRFEGLEEGFDAADTAGSFHIVAEDTQGQFRFCLPQALEQETGSSHQPFDPGEGMFGGLPAQFHPFAIVCRRSLVHRLAGVLVEGAHDHPHQVITAHVAGKRHRPET